jgi:PilZ domain
MPSPQTGDPDLRRWQRFSLQVPVRLVVHRPAQVDYIIGNGSDLNEGGMCVLADIEMRTGEQVAVEFTPPAGDPLRLWAAVRNRRDYRYGLEFLAENFGEREQVERYRHALRAATKPN